MSKPLAPAQPRCPVKGCERAHTHITLGPYSGQPLTPEESAVLNAPSKKPAPAPSERLEMGGVLTIAALARVARLLEVIEKAPHGRTQLNAVSRTCSINRDRPCDCWKAAGRGEENGK